MHSTLCYACVCSTACTSRLGHYIRLHEVLGYEDVRYTVTIKKAKLGKYRRQTILAINPSSSSRSDVFKYFDCPDLLLGIGLYER